MNARTAPLRVLIAADSFKDALGAPDVCRAIAQGVRQSHPQATVVEFPLGDGGEGTCEVLSHHLHLSSIEIDALDPLLRPLRAPYGLSADGRTAVIEMAQTAGLQLLEPEERNPAVTSTFGTGMQLADACRRGITRAVLAIGGSATNDAGIGMAAAMGWRFVDTRGENLSPVGGNLSRVARVIAPALSAPLPELDVICDVTNPLSGPEGAAHVYARQKGADPAMIEQLDTGLKHMADRVAVDLGLTGIAAQPGAGAAGGLGFGAMCFLDAHLRRGIDLIMDLTHFDAALARTDIVITGEGRLDGQTLHGKLIHGICQRARAMEVPVVALCGRLEATPDQLHAIGLREALEIDADKQPLSVALARTGENLQRSAAKLMLQPA